MISWSIIRSPVKLSPGHHIIAYFQKLERPVANESDAVQLKEQKAVNNSFLIQKDF